MGQEKSSSQQPAGPPAYRLIETAADLVKTAERLIREPSLAIDLEADSMYHFKERVCLIQIASPGAHYVVDPLQVSDLSPLKPIFGDRKIRKILHGADYDVRSLYRDFEIELNHLFDTQIASRFLGFQETGLDALLHHYFNVRLIKKYQKKDWSQRPLPPDMLAYAVMDVTYLIRLAQILELALKEKGRLEWVFEECERLSRVRAAPPSDGPLFLQFKGAGRLGGRSLAVLEALLQLRVEIAAKRDRPLFKVFSNESMLRLAVAKPASAEQLKAAKVLSARQIRYNGRAILKAISRGLALPETELPRYPRKKAPPQDPAVPPRIKVIKRWRDKAARRLKVDPSLIFTKEMLCRIAQKNPCRVQDLKTVCGMTAWQQNTFGPDLVRVLHQKGHPSRK